MVVVASVGSRLPAVLLAVFAAAPDAATANAPGRFEVPQQPPSSRYVIDAHIDPEAGVLKGSARITLANGSSIQLEAFALEWDGGRDDTLAVAVDGRVLAAREPGAAGGASSPRFYSLPNPVEPGASARLDIQFAVKDERGSDDPEWGSTSWYPRVWWSGLPLHDAYSVKLDIPPGWVVAASGRLDPKTGRWEAARARTFGIYLGKGLQSERREVDGVQVTALFTEKGAGAARACLDAGGEAIAFYREWLGFYPFPFLSIIPGGPDRSGGFPFATGIVAIHGLETFAVGEPLTHWQYITSHEIGHQYWGEWVLDGDDPGWLWIALGIFADTEFMTTRGHDPERRHKWTANYERSLSMLCNTTVDQPPARVDRIAYDWNNTVVHSKCPAIVFALDDLLGREAFLRVYRKALREFGGRRLGWRDLQRLCESETGVNLQWFFDAWVRSNAYVCYELEPRESEATPGGFRTEVVVRQCGTMAMPVPVQAVFDDGSQQVVLLDRTVGDQTLVFQSGTRLKAVRLDPEGRWAKATRALPVVSARAAAALAFGWDPADAPDVFEAVKDEEIESPDLWSRLGQNLYELDAVDDAATCFDRALSCATDGFMRFLALAWSGIVEDVRGRRDRALAHYRSALALGTDKPLTISQLQLRVDAGWLQARLESPYSRASTLDLPERPTAEQLVAAVDAMGWTHEGRNPKVVLDRSSGLEISSPRFWLKLALLLFDSGFTGEAYTAFEKVTALDASALHRFAAWTWMGHLGDLGGRREQALACYRKALELDPGTAMKHSQYGMKIDRAWVQARLRRPFTWQSRRGPQP